MAKPTHLIRSDRFREHDTGPHPENARRLMALDERLRSSGLLERLPSLEPEAATVEDIRLVHALDYVQLIEQASESGGGYLDPDTIVSERTYDVALLAAGAAIKAVDIVMEGSANRAFAMPRPPGHHAGTLRGMGFCIFNNVAIAARQALDRHGLQRVAIVDWDVHHGNGTQDIFYDSDQVLFVSLHRYGGYFFPGTGSANETGAGWGKGYTLNLPLPGAAGDAEYLALFDEVVGPKLAAFKPELILVSAGFDAHAADPLADMMVTEAGFRGMAERVRDWADELSEGRLVAILEGGYNLDALASSVEAMLRAWEEPSET